MISLEMALSSLEKTEIIEVLTEMIKKATVSISYTGRRLLAIEGYSGTVSIDDFATKFLNANELDIINSSPTLNQRLSCYNLWKKIKCLYEESDIQLDNSYIMGRLTRNTEAIGFINSGFQRGPRAIICKWDYVSVDKTDLFLFSKEDYENIFGKSALSVKKLIRKNDTGETIELFKATLEMVQNAYNQAHIRPTTEVT